MLDIIPSKSVLIDLIGQSMFEIWQALCSAIDKNTRWNESGIQVERTGNTSINIAEAEKHYAPCTQGKKVSAFWSFSERLKEIILRISEPLFRMLSANNMMTLPSIMTGNGSCLNQQILLSLMIILSCWLSKENRIGNNNSNFAR